MNKRHKREKRVGPFNVIVGETYNALGDGIALMQLGLQLETLPLIAIALDVVDCNGVDIDNALYRIALVDASFSETGALRSEIIQAAQREVLRKGIAKLRERGVDIPPQEWEK